MRILEVAPLWERVPPPAYGGTEAIVSLLTDGLVRLGHEVVLRASGDSITLAELRSVYPRSLRTENGLDSTVPYEIAHVADALRDARDFDIIHNHVGEMLMAFDDFIDTPMLTTTHGNLIEESRVIWERYDGFYNTISRSQANYITGFPRARFVGVVHNAIDVASFPFRADKEDYFLCLARVSPEKGTHIAIEVARRADIPLLIAGKVDNKDVEYFHSSVEPLVDGRQVRFVGEADGAEKRRLYAGARALLAPIVWEEPFGLVMPEAMACGTPVIAFARGAAPEIIVSGETGFLVDSVDEMVEATRRVREIDPKRCRDHVRRYFDAPVMVDAYVRVYESMLDTVRAERMPATGIESNLRIAG